MNNTARVILWGSDIGAVTWVPDRRVGVFQYTPEFANSGIEVAPEMMPLTDMPYEFPSLSRETFKGLPGMLADSLPDKFGTKLIEAWLASQGRKPSSFTPIEQLCYTGIRGMGALEFHPPITDAQKSSTVEINDLVALSNRVLDDQIALEDKLSGVKDKQAIKDLMRVSTSAGGARAKAVISWNPNTGEFRSGQTSDSQGFSPWLVKFDGVSGNKDHELADPLGFGRIEYAYYLMACDAGIKMQKCRLHEEGGRAHFMTRRFDRTPNGDKVHMQSLGALMHYDFNNTGAYGYEQVIRTIKRLDLSVDDVEQQVLRTFFNVLARNQDDHVKNIAFLMDRKGVWYLSPAFDIVYFYNPSGEWTDQHQMSLGGKRHGFELEDLLAIAGVGGLKKARAKLLLGKVSTAVSNWRYFATQAGMSLVDVNRIEKAHRRQLFV